MATNEWIPTDRVAAITKAGRIVARKKIRLGRVLIFLICLASVCGCNIRRFDLGENRLFSRFRGIRPNQTKQERDGAAESPRSREDNVEIQQVSGVDEDRSDSPDGQVTPASLDDLSLLDSSIPPAPDGPTQPIELEQVIEAIHTSFPLLRIAIFSRNVAVGDNVAAQGEFDLKLKADTFNQALGYYQNYRQGVGIEQPLFGGGNVFGGYRIGQGKFEPWYGNRQTNGGGEFVAGLSVPLWQNRTIDERRAQLWRTELGKSAMEPEIARQLLDFVRDGSIAYWEWVAAGQNYRFAGELLELAQERDEQLRRQVTEGDRAEADLTDNERLIVGRRVKRLDALRKLQLTAAKLSLYLRLGDGSPFIPGPELLPNGFPEATPVKPELIDSDIAFAQDRRPEFLALQIARQQLDVDLRQAFNLMQPTMDAQLYNSKDVGEQEDLGEKNPYLLEAGLQFSVPLQRRKARGKITAVEGKIIQWQAKRQFASDKVSVEVRAAVIALDTAYQAIEQAREAIRLNQEMEKYETIRLEEGDSDFLRLNLREMATFDARVVEIDALMRYFEAQAEFRAAVAADLPQVIEMVP